VEFLPDSRHAVLGESGETKSRRPRRNHTPGFEAKGPRWLLPPSKAIEHWLSWRSSSTSRRISGPTAACPGPAHREAAISTSTTAADLTRPLTGAHPIKLTSPRCPSAWRPNHGSRFTYPKLFRQPGPPHRACSRLRMAPYAAMARARNANSSPIPKIVRRLTTITRAPILAHAEMIALSRSDKWQLATCARNEEGGVSQFPNSLGTGALVHYWVDGPAAASSNFCRVS
jgi:hypothetical protein